MSAHSSDTRARHQRLTHAITQEPAILTRLSLSRAIDARESPSAIFMGFGFCSRDALSHALPLDALTMLLAGERLRRAAGAKHLVVLLADAHCAINQLAGAQATRRVKEVERLLAGVKVRAGLRALKIVRASTFHRQEAYGAHLAQILATAQAEEASYFHLEAADVAYVQQRFGRVIKLGWAISNDVRTRTHDERAFDRKIDEWLASPPLGYVYCAAGRLLDDARPKGSPYLECDPARRICLDPREDVRAKLERARARGVSIEKIKGVRKALRRASRLYASLIARRPEGDLEARTQAIIDALFAPSVERSAGEQIAATYAGQRPSFRCTVG